MGLKQLGCALTVSCHLARQKGTDEGKCLDEGIIRLALPGDLLIAGQTVCHQKQRVIGRGISIYRDHIEGILHHCGKCLLQQRLVDGKIRGQETKHGTHIGVDHAGALAHSAQGNGLSVHLKGDSDLLVDRVSRHDRLGSQRSCLLGIRQRSAHLRHAVYQLLYGKLHSDDTGRCHSNRVRSDSQICLDCLGCCLAGIPALFSGAGVCDTGVDHYCLQLSSAIHNFLIPLHTGSLHHIGGKGSGTLAGDL